MNFIKTYEDLQAIPLGTRIYSYENGNVRMYNMLGTFNRDKTVLLALDNSLEKTRQVYSHQFKQDVWSLEHDAVEVGQLMIKQIIEKAASEIESINFVYIKGDLKLTKELYVGDFDKAIDGVIEKYKNNKHITV